MEPWIAPVALVFSALATIVGTTWRVRAMLDTRDAAIVKMMTDHELADARRFGEVNNQILETSRAFQGYLGETGRALREHMHSIQLGMEQTKASNLDLFVRRDSYFHIMNGLNARFDKMDEKLVALHPKNFEPIIRA